LKSTKELEEMLKTGQCECPVCHGVGSRMKREYQRERGTLHAILRSYPCDNCNGEGKVTLPIEAETYLSPFIQMSKKLIQLETYFSKILAITKVIADPGA